MKSKLKVTLGISLVGCLLLMSTAFATNAGVSGAPTIIVGSNTDLDALETGVGQLTSGIDFGSLGTIDMKSAIAASTVADYVGVYDDRGKNSGWSVKVSALALTATVEDDTAPTASPAPTATVTIPIGSVMQLNAPAADLKKYNGSKAGGVTLNSSTIALSNAGDTLISAVKGKGAGAYSLKANYTLSLPNYLPSGSTVVPSNPSGSTLDEAAAADVTSFGLFAGTYSTTITYAAGLAP